MKKLVALLLVAIGSALAVAMMASWPQNVVGTWKGFANQTEVQLVITTQGTTGSCRSITGTFSNLPSGGASNIHGFYCPSTGRVSFVRTDVDSGAFQSYSANLSDVGRESRMAGTFAELNMAGYLGEYNFAVSRPEHSPHP